MAHWIADLSRLCKIKKTQFNSYMHMKAGLFKEVQVISTHVHLYIDSDYTYTDLECTMKY